MQGTTELWPAVCARRLKHCTLLAPLVQAPFYPASAGNVEKEKTVEDGQLAFIDCREKFGTGLEFPVVLDISHGHFTAAQKSRHARFEP